MKRYCLALDLKDDPQSIAAYDDYHRAVWPEILKSLDDAGIHQMEIYRTGNRLFMIMDVRDEFSFEKKAIADLNNPRVQEWEKLMSNYQQDLPASKPGEKWKWKLMDKVFSLR
jgi:L-rhamnose mutarotase